MPMFKRGCVVLLLISASACGGGNSTTTSPAAPSVSSVTVSGTAPNVGATAQFSATTNLSNGTTQTVTSQATWSSSNASVASVSNSGAVTGVGIGEADIIAAYQGVSGKSHIAVAGPTTSPSIDGTYTGNITGTLLPAPVSTIVTGNVRVTLTSNAGSVSGTWATTFTNQTINNSGSVSGTLTDTMLSMTLTPGLPTTCPLVVTAMRNTSQITGTYAAVICGVDPYRATGTITLTKQ